MSVKLHNDTANGTATIKASNTAGDVIVTAPEFSADIGVRPVLMEAQATTSGTFKDFVGIPSWAKKITVMFNGVSTSGVSPIVVQIGSSTIDTSGYLGGGTLLINVGAIIYSNTVTLGLPIECAQANLTSSTVRHGRAVLTTLGGNVWSFDAKLSHTGTVTAGLGDGSKTLSGELDRIRITTVNGTDTFDAGMVNIRYEA